MPGQRFLHYWKHLVRPALHRSAAGIVHRENPAYAAFPFATKPKLLEHEFFQQTIKAHFFQQFLIYS